MSIYQNIEKLTTIFNPSLNHCHIFCVGPDSKIIIIPFPSMAEIVGSRQVFPDITLPSNQGS